ncbi:MAG: molybdopterin-dependent oxidoreductase [Acidimicrobiia bacterium]|nr:molybdopterin-dependent oxidoreductase [Acidimicrobiia bacterium]
MPLVEDPLPVSPTPPASTSPLTVRRGYVSVIVGVVAAAVGLATAEVVAGLVDAWRSPVLDVGDRVIDATPAWLKDLAIAWFDTNDKAALLVGIGVLLVLYAAGVGVVAVRFGLRWGIVAVVPFAAAGSLSVLADRVERSWTGVLPTVVGAGAACGALALLRWSLTRGQAVTGSGGADHHSDASESPRDEVAVGAIDGRRSFLLLAGTLTVAATAAAGAGRWLEGRFSAAASRAGLSLRPADRPLPPPPTAAALDIDGVSPLFTPNSDFYRIDTALVVPQVVAEDWSLRVTGMVDQPLELSYDELLARELVEADITLTCVSNEVGGNLVGTARWLGVRLDDLLADAGIDPAADQIVGRSTDGYTCGFPVDTLDGRDALVAVAMNGEPLPLRHGFPARLIVPGLYGYVSATKWLTEIELTRFDQFDQYWVPRGWDAEAPIKIQTRVDTPRGLANLSPGLVPVAGVAWAQTRGIESVQVRIDDGDWQEADLAEAVNVDTWRQWSMPWEATPGRHTIAARAVDGDGVIQTEERSEQMPNGASGWHQIVVLVGDN